MLNHSTRWTEYHLPKSHFNNVTYLGLRAHDIHENEYMLQGISLEENISTTDSNSGRYYSYSGVYSYFILIPISSTPTP